MNGATCTPGEGVVFDGTDDYVEFAASAVVNCGIACGALDFTVALWFTTNSGDAYLWSSGRDEFNANGEIILRLENSGRANVWTYYNGYKWHVTGTSAINDGAWHQVALVQSTALGGGSLYVDGSAVGSSSAGALPINDVAPAYAGGNIRGQNDWFGGTIATMQIWSRALDAAEVASLHALGGACLATPTSAPTITGVPTPAPTPLPTPLPTPDHMLALDHSLCFDQCALDDQVGGMHATLMNGATCTPGEGVVFDGTDDYVDLADQSLGGPMTIAFWARWDALNHQSRLFDFGDGQRVDNIIIANSAASATIGFYIRIGSSSKSTS